MVLSSLRIHALAWLRALSFRQIGSRYGHLIFWVTTIGVLIRIPANSNGIGVFTEFFLVALDLSRTELSTAYLIGNLVMAFCMPAAGRLYDRKGARFSLIFGSLGMGLSFLALAGLKELHDAWALSSTVMMLVMSMLYSAIGFFGQGVITSSCRNLLVTCFPFKRGAISSAQNLILSAAFAVTPLAILALLSEAGLTKTLVFIACFCGFGFALLVHTLIRDPVVEEPSQDETPAESCHAGYLRARSTGVFWLYALSLAFPFFFSSALTFNAIAIFAEVGRSETEAYAWLIPSMGLSLLFMVLTGLASDRRGTRGFVISMNIGYAAGAAGVALLESTLGWWMLVIGLGLGGGIRMAMASLSFVRLFGAKSLGSITGLASSLALGAGAAGPAVCVALKSLTGSYSTSFAVIALIPLLFTGWSLFQNNLASENRI